MSLESVVGFSVVEDLLERRILERGTVNVTGDPVVVEYRSTLVVMWLFFILVTVLNTTGSRNSRYHRGTCNPPHR